MNEQKNGDCAETVEALKNDHGRDCKEHWALTSLCGESQNAVMTIADGWEQADEKIPLENSAGRISGEYIYLYPPGIPFVVPGEQISQDVVDLVKRYQECGYSVQGMADKSCKEIRVVK